MPGDPGQLADEVLRTAGPEVLAGHHLWIHAPVTAIGAAAATQNGDNGVQIGAIPIVFQAQVALVDGRDERQLIQVFDVPALRVVANALRGAVTQAGDVGQVPARGERACQVPQRVVVLAAGDRVECRPRAQGLSGERCDMRTDSNQEGTGGVFQRCRGALVYGHGRCRRVQDDQLWLEVAGFRNDRGARQTAGHGVAQTNFSAVFFEHTGRVCQPVWIVQRTAAPHGRAARGARQGPRERRIQE